MEMALSKDRLAIGTSMQFWDHVNVRAVAAKLKPPGRHDGGFLASSCQVTGNIQIHEMAWGTNDELWVVNTRFSCLCTIDRSARFSPRWRPPLISSLEPTDRCHLDGLAMVNGKPRYVTALGETDTAAGWRENKARGESCSILKRVRSSYVVFPCLILRADMADPGEPGEQTQSCEVTLPLSNILVNMSSCG